MGWRSVLRGGVNLDWLNASGRDARRSAGKGGRVTRKRRHRLGRHTGQYFGLPDMARGSRGRRRKGRR